MANDSDDEVLLLADFRNVPPLEPIVAATARAAQVWRKRSPELMMLARTAKAAKRARRSHTDTLQTLQCHEDFYTKLRLVIADPTTQLAAAPI